MNNNNRIIHKSSSYTNSVTLTEIIHLNNPNINNYQNQKEEPITQFQFNITYRTIVTSCYGHVSNEDGDYTPDGNTPDVVYYPASETLSEPLGVDKMHSFEATYKALSPILSTIGVKRRSARTDVAQAVTEFCKWFINAKNKYSRLVVGAVAIERQVEQWERSMDDDDINDEFYWMDNMEIVDLHLDGYRVGEDDDDDELGKSCAVCLEEFGVGTKGARMPHCLHLFHVNCICNWLRKNLSCPVCRSQLDISST
ncbi:uncharacterized protein LOC133030658 [Cannabis sativa]|uniref:uncharacterized protein LOC133030658 n=1 Tax=Cannabis sativa TaxID=3483 RepID=UPI0029CA40BF|nr:uncharacterized protein LOC133030658 [Cannabis sativa]